jgi:hypothetical protein
MGGVQQQGLPERERLLVMAAFLHGAKPGAEIRANCGRVLRQALAWAGLWDDQAEYDYRRDNDNPVIDDWYCTLIAMTRRAPKSELLIKGQGNFGSPVDPPASPRYTGCRLTDKGRELAAALFAEHPECRAT